MRIVVDPNRCAEDAEGAPLASKALKLNGEEVLVSDPKPDDTEREPVPRPVPRCPMRAIFGDALDTWLSQVPGLQHTHQTKPDVD
jgi:ferredoxin